MIEAVLFDTAQMRHGCARLFVCSLGQDAGFGPKTGAQTNLPEAGRVPQGLSFRVKKMEVYVDGREPPALLYYVSIHVIGRDLPFADLADAIVRPRSFGCPVLGSTIRRTWIAGSNHSCTMLRFG